MARAASESPGRGTPPPAPPPAPPTPLTSPEDRAYSTALRILRARAGGLTRAQLRERLLTKGHAPLAAAAAVQRLVDHRLLSDRAVASSLARGTLARGQSINAAKRTLQGRGLARAVKSEAIDEARADDPRTERQRALEAAKKKLTPSLKAKPADAQRRSLFGLLARRGFDEETCREVVEQLVPGADLD